MPEHATVMLHIGTRKSGTTYLQYGFRDSAPALAEQGLEFTYQPRAQQMSDWVTPLRAVARGESPAPLIASIRAYADRVRASPLPRHMISLEDFAEFPPEAIAHFRDGLAEFDLHVVLTARHWGRTIPSEWQQNVKERDTTSYADFLAAIRDGSPAAARFRARHHLPEIARRWAAAVPEGHLHLIAVPPSSGAVSLTELFAGLAGVDPASLTMPSGGVNESLSLPQAELLRRINAELGTRMPGDAYHDGVRGWLTRGTLMRQGRTPIGIPDEFAGWVREQAQAHHDELLALPGIDLVGDPADLLVPADPGIPGISGSHTDPEIPGMPSTPTDSEMNETAVRAIADLVDRHWAQAERDRARLAELERERDEARHRADEGVAGLARRAVRRLRGSDA